jgi:hypothetical protein
MPRWVVFHEPPLLLLRPSCENARMVEFGGKISKRGAVAIAEIVGKTLDPITAKRGFAASQLTAAWAEIVGQRYADCSLPEKIVWPRGAANEGRSGMLVVRIDGPRALLFQHELPQVIERVNATLGHGTIDRIRIVQAPVQPASGGVKPMRPLDAQEESQLADLVGGVDSADLRGALERLGRGILARRDKK